MAMEIAGRVDIGKMIPYNYEYNWGTKIGYSFEDFDSIPPTDVVMYLSKGREEDGYVYHKILWRGMAGLVVYQTFFEEVENNE